MSKNRLQKLVGISKEQISLETLIENIEEELRAYSENQFADPKIIERLQGFLKYLKNEYNIEEL